jgi:proline iminopeptidase
MFRFAPLIAALTALCIDSVASASPLSSELRAGSHIVNIGEVSLHYQVRGHGPVTFVEAPGWGSTSAYLRGTLRPLERYATLVYIDPRGSGGSSRPADRRRMSQLIMADDLDALRIKLGLQTINLFGHSDAGTIAVAYAEHHGSHLNKAVIVDGWLTGDPDARKTRSAMIALWKNDPRYMGAIQQLQNMPDLSTMSDQTMAEALARTVPIFFSDPQRYVPILNAAQGKAHLSAWANSAEDEADMEKAESQLALAHTITSKLLIINGTVDLMCPYIAAQHLHEAVPGSQLSLYVNSGHFPWIEQPKRFFAEVGEFLRST